NGSFSGRAVAASVAAAAGAVPVTAAGAAVSWLPRSGGFAGRAFFLGVGAGASSCGAVTVCCAKYFWAPNQPATSNPEVTSMVTTTTPKTLLRSVLMGGIPLDVSARVGRDANGFSEP